MCAWCPGNHISFVLFAHFAECYWFLTSQHKGCFSVQILLGLFREDLHQCFEANLTIFNHLRWWIFFFFILLLSAVNSALHEFFPLLYETPVRISLKPFIFLSHIFRYLSFVRVLTERAEDRRVDSFIEITFKSFKKCSLNAESTQLVLTGALPSRMAVFRLLALRALSQFSF